MLDIRVNAKEEHHAITFYSNCKAVFISTARKEEKDIKTNLVNLLTKMLIFERPNFLMDRFMY